MASLPSIPSTPISAAKAAVGGPRKAVTSSVSPDPGAANVRLGAAVSEETPIMADYYRDGKLSESGTYAVTPARFSDFSGTRASIRMYSAGTPSGKPVEDEKIIPPYTKFILESVQESHAERTQVVETFGDFYVFMFGERPPTYTFSGVLINTRNANWVSDFMYYYETHLRGSQCLERQAKLVLTYGGRQVEGYMLNIGHVTNAANEGAVTVSFSIIVTARNYLGFSDDFGVTLGSDGSYTTDASYAKLAKSARDAAEAGAGTSDRAVSGSFSKAKRALSMADLPQVSSTYSGVDTSAFAGGGSVA